MKENTRIDFFIFAASFALMLASVLGALNDRFETLNVMLSFVWWGTLFGTAFIFSWFFRRSRPALCDGASLAVALGTVAYFAYQILRGQPGQELGLPLMIRFIICLQLALSLALKDKREFYLTYFLSFVLILYGAYISVSLFFFFLFAVYFISGTLVLSLETVADFDLSKISALEKKSLFVFFGLFFSLVVFCIIFLSLGFYLVIPKWSLAPYFNYWNRSQISGKSDARFWEQLYGQELDKKLCNKTDLDRVLSRLVTSVPWARDIVRDDSSLNKIRSRGEEALPPATPKNNSEQALAGVGQTEMNNSWKIIETQLPVAGTGPAKTQISRVTKTSAPDTSQPPAATETAEARIGVPPKVAVSVTPAQQRAISAVVRQEMPEFNKRVGEQTPPEANKLLTEEELAAAVTKGASRALSEVSAGIESGPGPENKKNISRAAVKEILASLESAEPITAAAALKKPPLKPLAAIKPLTEKKPKVLKKPVVPKNPEIPGTAPPAASQRPAKKPGVIPGLKNMFFIWWLIPVILILSVIMRYYRRFQDFLADLLPPGKAVIGFYRSAEKKLAGRGYRKKPAQTPAEFAGQLPDGGYPLEKNPFLKLTGLFEIAFYSGQKILYTQKAEARDLYREIAGVLVRKIKKNKNHESRHSP